MPVRVLGSMAKGNVKDVSISSSTELQIYGLQYSTIENNGTLTLLPGDFRSGGGSTTFLQLTDTPSSYSGQAGKIVSVKSDESGLEFGSVTDVENADKLDGQHGSYYLNASNINAGTLSTDRYSAYADLQAEGYFKYADTNIPLTSHLKRFIRATTIIQDFSGSSLPSGWSWAGSPFGGAPYCEYGVATTYLRISALNTGYRHFLYRSAPPSGNVVSLMLAFNLISNNSYAGLRLDDGSDSNYMEFVIKYYSTSPNIRLTARGSTITDTDIVSFTHSLPSLLVFGLGIFGSPYSSWNCSVMLQTHGGLTNWYPFGDNKSWTATRIGLVMYYTGTISTVDVMLDAVLAHANF